MPRFLQKIFYVFLGGGDEAIAIHSRNHKKTADYYREEMLVEQVARARATKHPGKLSGDLLKELKKYIDDAAKA